MLTRTRALLAVALLAGGAAACSDVTGANARADGVYYLQTVNGTTVPYSYVDNTTGNTVTIESDTYALNSNGTYSDQAISRIDNGTQVSTQSYSESGTWTQRSNVVTFTPSQSSGNNFSIYDGTIATSSSFNGTRTLTISGNGATAIYSE